MSDNLNQASAGNKLHIGFFGKRNSGKSSLINALCSQEVSIVSDTPGTTTDAVYKSIELRGIGACVLMDTAGFDDFGTLGKQRVEKTRLAAQKSDVAVIVCADTKLVLEQEWYKDFHRRNIPVIFLISKEDILGDTEPIREAIGKITKEIPIAVSAVTGFGLDILKEQLMRAVPDEWEIRTLTGDLVKEGDSVMLVMPQDMEAPKGRLILPQVQTIRELLDKRCIVTCTTGEDMPKAIAALKKAPDLIITDSQVFKTAYENKPEESRLTSFSMLFAAYKGDIDYYVKSAECFEKLEKTSRILIAECCTHAPLEEDIGRVKLPNLLREKYGHYLQIDIVSGTNFPKDLEKYDLIIQCGGCMFSRTYVKARIDIAKAKEVPMTNYGVALAYLNGILDKVTI